MVAHAGSELRIENKPSSGKYLVSKCLTVSVRGASLSWDDLNKLENNVAWLPKKLWYL